MKKFFAKVGLFLLWTLLAGVMVGLTIGLWQKLNIVTWSHRGQTLYLIGMVAGTTFFVTLAIVSLILCLRYKKVKPTIEVTLKRKDILLQSGRSYVIGKNNKKGHIKAGKYLVLAVDETSGTFQIRLGGLTKGYRHNSVLVLVEGDEISPRSANIILRKA